MLLRLGRERGTVPVKRLPWRGIYGGVRSTPSQQRIVHSPKTRQNLCDLLSAGRHMNMTWKGFTKRQRNEFEPHLLWMREAQALDHRAARRDLSPLKSLRETAARRDLKN